MRKSSVVKLVLLNSLLALSACRKPCDQDEKKDQVDQPDAKAKTSCTGSSSGHGSGRGARVFPYYLGGRAVHRASSPSAPSHGTTGSVSRGGFGSSGSAAHS